jgi:citrate synthase
MQLSLPSLALRDPTRFVTSDEASLAIGRRLIRQLISATGCSYDAQRRASQAPSAARAFLLAMGQTPRRATADAVNCVMVLLADHELNPSSFAARVAASAGADLYACTAAALATLSGPRHGGMPDRVLALLDAIGRPEHAARVVSERLRRGDGIEGFGHPLYPAGDPRAPVMLDVAKRLGRGDRRLRTLDALIDTMRLVGADAPTVDVGLVALACALRLPAGGATALFAAGRMAGWIAHALEQRRAGYILRPRARYNAHLEP